MPVHFRGPSSHDRSSTKNDTEVWYPGKEGTLQTDLIKDRQSRQEQSSIQTGQRNSGLESESPNSDHSFHSAVGSIDNTESKSAIDTPPSSVSSTRSPKDKSAMFEEGLRTLGSEFDARDGRTDTFASERSAAHRHRRHGSSRHHTGRSRSRLHDDDKTDFVVSYPTSRGRHLTRSPSKHSRRSSRHHHQSSSRLTDHDISAFVRRTDRWLTSAVDGNDSHVRNAAYDGRDAVSKWERHMSTANFESMSKKISDFYQSRADFIDRESTSSYTHVSYDQTSSASSSEYHHRHSVRFAPSGRTHTRRRTSASRTGPSRARRTTYESIPINSYISAHTLRPTGIPTFRTVGDSSYRPSGHSRRSRHRTSRARPSNHSHFSRTQDMSRSTFGTRPLSKAERYTRALTDERSALTDALQSAHSGYELNARQRATNIEREAVLSRRKDMSSVMKSRLMSHVDSEIGQNESNMDLYSDVYQGLKSEISGVTSELKKWASRW